MAPLNKKVWQLILALVVWLFVGTLGYLGSKPQYPPGKDPGLVVRVIDAVWFSSQTLTTTGYGSIPETVWNPTLKIVSIITMIVGASLWSNLIAKLFKSN